jgi:transposase
MYVAGIDAHTTYLSVVVLDKAGVVQVPAKRIRVEHPERLLALLEPFRPLEVVVETCPSWAWVHDLVVSQGIGFVLAHARRLRAIAEANYKKDELDAELLGRMRLAGLIPSVFPKPREQRERALLVRQRAHLVRTRTALANRIHSQLHSVGLRLERGRLLTLSGQRWLRETAWPKLGPEQRRLVKTHLRLIRGLQPLIEALDRRIRYVAAQSPEARLLQTIPGIGAYRSLVLVSELLPIERFGHSKYLVSYAGLAPRSKQSGERPVRHLPIPAGANRQLRGTLVRSVVSHLQQAPESQLSRSYAEQKKRLGWPVARVATARRLTRAIYAMLKQGSSWQDVSERGKLQDDTVAQTTNSL